jgi:hypothetical protein
MKRILLTAMLLGCYDAAPVGWDTDDSDSIIEPLSITEQFEAPTQGHPSASATLDCDNLAELSDWHVNRCNIISGSLPIECTEAAVAALWGGDLEAYVQACGGDVLYLRGTHE